jgi:iron complex transport system ATP-binding protein
MRQTPVHARERSPASEAGPLLRTHALALRAGPRELVRGLDLRVERGQFWAVIGPNGAGKTTLLATLAGLAKPAGGRIELLGRPLEQWKPLEAARRRGFLPQHVEPLFGVAVLQAVLLGRHPHAGRHGWALWESADDVALARAAIERMGLAALAAREVASLSGGERQRVAIASLLAQDPQLALLDEPLTHLDLHHQQAVMRLLRERALEGEGAVVASVHDLSLAARYATHALVFTGGGACAGGSAADVLDEATLSAAFAHRVRRLADGDLVAWVAG